MPAARPKRDAISADIAKQNAKYLEEEKKEMERTRRYQADDVVQECEDEEGSSEEERERAPKRFKFDDVSSESDSECKKEDTESKQTDTSFKADTSMATTQEPSVIISQNDTHQWCLASLLTVEETSDTLLDYDTHNERLFMLFGSFRLVIANTQTRQVV